MRLTPTNNPDSIKKLLASNTIKTLGHAEKQWKAFNDLHCVTAAKAARHFDGDTNKAVSKTLHTSTAGLGKQDGVNSE